MCTRSVFIIIIRVCSTFDDDFPGGGAHVGPTCVGGVDEGDDEVGADDVDDGVWVGVLVGDLDGLCGEELFILR
jgi:hypothetical protein